MPDEATTTETETTETETTEQESAPRTFSQADLDRIVQDRVARERKKYEGFDELQTKAAEYDKLQEAQRSELEKAQARAEKAEKAAADALAQAKATALRSSLLAEAAKAERSIVDPEGALAFLTGVDAGLMELDKDGNPVDIAKAMDALLEKRPYLVAAEEAKPRPGGADQGARGGGKNQLASTQGMSPEEIVKARREGRLDNLLQGGN